MITQIRKWIRTVIMLLLGITMIMPFVWMISASLKLPINVYEYPVKWIPDEFHFENYAEVWFGKYPFSTYYLNSIKIAVINVTGIILTSTMAGYAFAKIQFKFREQLFLLFLATMMIPGQVTLIPTFIMFNKFQILDTHWALVLPGVFSTFGVFMIRQFMLQIPNELLEAAKIDGAGYFRIWYSIMLPACKAAIASLCILTFTWNWCNYMAPLVFLTKQKLYTIPLGMSNFLLTEKTQLTLIMAASVTSTVPMILVFLGGQKYFIRGIVTSGLKG